jgi:AcrR family transcriptional regulator
MSEQSGQLEKQFMEGFERMVPDANVRSILLHALQVFSQKGLDGTKIKDIASVAGFSQGYVYHYFSSKDEIFTKLVELAAQGAGDSVRYAAGLPGTPYQKLAWLTEALLSPDSIAMSHWRLITLQAAISEAIPDEAKRISKEKMREPFAHLLPIILEGQKAGELVEEDPLMLGITYFSIIQGLAVTRIQNEPGIPFPAVETVLRFIRRGGSHDGQRL